MRDPTMTDGGNRPIEAPEIVKREERIKHGAVAELQRAGQEMDAMSDPTTADDERQFDAQVTGPRMPTTAKPSTTIDGLTQAEREEQLIRLMGERARPLCSTTAETPTMRERLARLHAGRFYDSDREMNNGPEHRQEYIDYRWPVFVKGVEEDLREMLEPSEGMLVAARDWSIAKYGIPVGDDGATGCMQAMIQSILNETKD